MEALLVIAYMITTIGGWVYAIKSSQLVGCGFSMILFLGSLIPGVGLVLMLLLIGNYIDEKLKT